MEIMNAVKEGADLTHPKPTIGYVIGGIIAVVVIMGILWIVAKGKAIIAPAATSVTGGLETQATAQLAGFL
jgi:hypothetical protein